MMLVLWNNQYVVQMDIDSFNIIGSGAFFGVDEATCGNAEAKEKPFRRNMNPYLTT